MTTRIMDGGDTLIEVLNANGVEYIFASPGSEWPPLWEALSRRKAEGEKAPEYITCRHEALAVGAAAGYYRSTGKLPAVVMHTTVGTVNAATALRGSLHDGTPMVVVSGESIGYGDMPGKDPGSQWLQELSDIGGPEKLVAPVMKWTATVRARETLSDTFHRACRIAMESPRGPVYVDAPLEIMLQQIETRIAEPPEIEASFTADERTLGEFANLLVGAEHPVVITEMMGRDPESVAPLVEIAEKLGLPVVEAATVGATNFPTDNPMHQGFESRPFLADADVVLLLDSPVPWHPPTAGPGESAKIINFSPDPDLHLRPYGPYPAHIVVRGDAGHNLRSLAAFVRETVLDDATKAKIEARRTTLTAAHKARRSEMTEAALALKDQEPISSLWAAHDINDAIPDHALVVWELITHRRLMERYLDRRTPGETLRSFGGLGQGLPNALGVKTANPDRLVVCLIGDGAFNYNPVLACYGYAQQHNQPFLTIIMNNLMYKSQQGSINRTYPDGVGKDLGPSFITGITPHPDYPKLVEAFGGWGALVTKPDQIIPVLKEAIAKVEAGQSALVDILLNE
ncbi:MAG: thiamine pyrophosphate-binding protein [Chloroflexi bacterium]|nr:thiamine pyrophosphate-binding protein [Chloroflexota bacterium]